MKASVLFIQLCMEWRQNHGLYEKGLMGDITYYVLILTGLNLLSALFNICTHITLGRR